MSIEEIKQEKKTEQAKIMWEQWQRLEQRACESRKFKLPQKYPALRKAMMTAFPSEYQENPPF